MGKEGRDCRKSETESCDEGKVEETEVGERMEDFTRALAPNNREHDIQVRGTRDNVSVRRGRG